MKKIFVFFAVLFSACSQPEQLNTTHSNNLSSLSFSNSNVLDSTSYALAKSLDEARENALKWKQQDNYLFLIQSVKNGSPGEYECELIKTDGMYQETIKCNVQDYFFEYFLEEENANNSGTNEYVEIIVNVESKKVQITVQKTNLILDFYNNTFEFRTEYRVKDLLPEDLIDQSPSKDKELYLTYFIGAGEWFSGDVVLLTKDSQTIDFVAPCETDFVDASFCGEDKVFVCCRNQASLLDISNTEFVSKAIGYNPSFTAVGANYDTNKQLLLVAFIENLELNIDNSKPSKLVVGLYNARGEYIKTINTEFEFLTWIGSFLNHVDFILSEDGTVIIQAVAKDTANNYVKVELGELRYS